MVDERQKLLVKVQTVICSIFNSHCQQKKPLLHPQKLNHMPLVHFRKTTSFVLIFR